MPVRPTRRKGAGGLSSSSWRASLRPKQALADAHAPLRVSRGEGVWSVHPVVSVLPCGGPAFELPKIDVSPSPCSARAAACGQSLAQRSSRSGSRRPRGGHGAGLPRSPITMSSSTEPPPLPTERVCDNGPGGGQCDEADSNMDAMAPSALQVPASNRMAAQGRCDGPSASGPGCYVRRGARARRPPSQGRMLPRSAMGPAARYFQS